MTTQERVELLGVPGSPYTRKMLSLLRYRRIPYNLILGGHKIGEESTRPVPKVKLLPTFYFPDGAGGVEAVVDSTPIIRRLEKDYVGRAALPTDPALGFVNDLIEDFADEWLTKPMFHYRWAHDEDAKNAGPLLIFWSDPTLPDDKAKEMAAFISNHQINRLYVVGSNDVTAPIIEGSFERLVGILDKLVQKNGCVLGPRPSSADFALFGQLTQLAYVEPTSAKLLNKASPRLRAWLDRVEDLSGLNVNEVEWPALSALAPSLRPLLTEIGRVYVPFLLANAKAFQAGDGSFEAEIDGRPWTQPTFPYQAKCLMWLRESFVALPAAAQGQVKDVLAATGCEPLLIA